MLKLPQGFTQEAYALAYMIAGLWSLAVLTAVIMYLY